jgi:hypothetical protein
MPDATDKLQLPLLLPAQAQKHVTHNEALVRLDTLVQLRLRSLGATIPPAAPEAGETHALGSGATGAWAGQDNRLASYSDGAWQFFIPQDGWLAVSETDNRLYVHSGGQWVRAVGAGDNLSGIGVGTAADPINRLAVASPASLFTHVGTDHRLNVNKATPGDTASLLFQTGWSGRAEMGLAGNDGFSIKVSADGSTWTTGLAVDSATGHVSAPQFRSGEITVGLNTAQSIPTPGSGGFLLISIVDASYPQATHSGLFCYDTGLSLQLTHLALGTGMANLGTTALTGTSGAVGNSSVAVTAGAILIENRFSGTRTYAYTFLGGN